MTGKLFFTRTGLVNLFHLQVLSWKTVTIFIVLGGAVVLYVRYLNQMKELGKAFCVLKLVVISVHRVKIFVNKVGWLVVWV